jgi:Mg2+-importing ATPase
MVDRPGRWDMRFIGRFMIEFGMLSSIFDLATFAILLAVFHAGPELFRTGWFVESLLTELVIALVVRTRRPFYESRPGRLLFVSTLILIAATFAVPYAPFASMLGFVPLSGALFTTIAAITAAYFAAAEVAKQWFFRHEAARQSRVWLSPRAGASASIP